MIMELGSFMLNLLIKNYTNDMGLGGKKEAKKKNLLACVSALKCAYVIIFV